MPGSPGYGPHQARDASLQVAKREHTIETDAPERRFGAGENGNGGANRCLPVSQFRARGQELPCG